MKHNLNNWATV